MVFILFIIILLGSFGHIYSTGLNDVIWHKMKAKSHVQPSGRFDVATWVDDQNHLWLFGGKTVTRTNGSELTNHLQDLWKFDSKAYEWSRIMKHNSSNYPQFASKHLSCFCIGQALVVAHQVHKNRQFPELWVYNISSNFWKLNQISRKIKNFQGCFALWCSKDSDSISMLCYNNTTVVKLWSFMTNLGTWNLQNISSMAKNNTEGYISKSSRFSVWNDPNGLVFVYVFSYPNTGKNSVLLTISYDNITVTPVNVTKPEYLSNRRGFIRWIDSHRNLHLLGGKISNVTAHSSGVHWVLNTTNYKWLTVGSRNLKPRPRSGALFWQVGGNLWLFGGCMKDGEDVIVLNDFWIGNTSKPALVPHQPTPIDHNLPGDTLGLSMVNKLIISMVTLFVVMAISVRLCYKRELNQLLSRLRSNRVLYHQLSQEGDKSTRL